MSFIGNKEKAKQNPVKNEFMWMMYVQKWFAHWEMNIQQVSDNCVELVTATLWAYYSIIDTMSWGFLWSSL